MNWLEPWMLLIPTAGLLLFFFVWRFYGIGGAIQAERARELFRLQRERLEQVFLEKAASSGLPRGLRWVACEFAAEIEFVRDRKTRRIVALVAVTIRFEAVEGGDMEGLPAVPLPRQGSAVLYFVHGEWTTSGRVIFNFAPAQVLHEFAADFERLHAGDG
jgi:hypothetical protein